ncbi:MAG: hypothetical protein K6F32_01825 [Bacilli bacterium]|nr:hypothetical protein [Bacilli bacterium]
MKLMERIGKMDEHRLVILILSLIGLFVFLCLTPFFFFNNPGVPLGWLLGTAIEVFNYWTIILSSGAILSPYSSKKTRGVAFVILFVFLRLAFWVGGLVLGALCTYTWQNNYLNIWSVFAGYVPMTVAVAIAFMGRGKKKIDDLANAPQKQEGESHD